MPGVVTAPRWLVAGELEVDRGPVAVGEVLARHGPGEVVDVADVVEAAELHSSFHSQASSPIQSVQRWMSHVSRIRP